MPRVAVSSRRWSGPTPGPVCCRSRRGTAGAAQRRPRARADRRRRGSPRPLPRGQRTSREHGGRTPRPASGIGEYHPTAERRKKWRRLAAPPSLGRKRPRSRQRDQGPHCCGAQRRWIIIRRQATFRAAAFTKAGQQGYPLVASSHLRKTPSSSLGPRNVRTPPWLAGCFVSRRPIRGMNQLSCPPTPRSPRLIRPKRAHSRREQSLVRAWTAW
jgi:hypothetical protein